MEHVQEYPPPVAPSAYQPLATRVSVIGPEYCYPQPVDLAVVRKVLTISEGKFAVSDINGNIMFITKGKIFSIHDRRLLTDAAGNPVCTLRHKIMTVHDRWQVFRRESTEEKDLIFTVKRSSMIQLKTKLHVFLATNPKENVCDFRVEGSWLERSCIIYSGEFNTILAQESERNEKRAKTEKMGQSTKSIRPGTPRTGRPHGHVNLAGSSTA
ncbi:protein LURP-one-related 15 isoform X2 [Gossypium hirsutum]|uniref:Protein LURP-one-related 15 isoform X2 n=1 Tax=Gossypium hirsutum TaxID=3635 RepID=A0ABM2YJ08_GOSHI|nr:protein LURP-one-related 15-like isoform X2 [Gossypium hirsutum]